MPANVFWNITFGPYAFTVHRADLTYRLEETETGTLWADGLSLGTVEITERESGTATRYPFGALQLVSLSEKSGANGKRILFGLEAPGRIPVDVYLTCTDREIQLTVEASRDTKTHRVGEILLLPGLCAVPADGASHLVIPHREGVILFADAAPEETTPLPIWDADSGLVMPFVGAVRVSLTPPAPLSLRRERGEAEGVGQHGERSDTASSLPPLPSEGEGGRGGEGFKRSKSALALLTDSAYAIADLSRTSDSAVLNMRYERDPERRRLDVRVVLMPGGDHIGIARAYRDKLIGDGGHVTLRKKMREKPALMAWLGGDGTAPTARKQVVLPAATNRWTSMENHAPEAEPENTVYFADLCGDWAVPFVDLWYYTDSPRFGVAVPLLAVVHHDAVPLCFDTDADGDKALLRALLHVAPPIPGRTPPSHVGILQPLHALSVGAFLTEHRFLTPDFAVEEARYSNGLRVVLNGSATDDYETAELHLPPLGFYVFHERMVLHHAWRVRAVQLSKKLAGNILPSVETAG